MLVIRNSKGSRKILFNSTIRLVIVVEVFKTTFYISFPRLD